MDALFQKDIDCCGCEACANVCSQSAITMTEDAYGFRYPQISAEKCIDCGLCIKKCDFQSRKDANIDSFNPYEAYAAYHTDEETLKLSASGGVFSAFAEYIIEQKGCVYGCIFDDDFNVRIVRADSIKEIDPMRGSKYLQSEVGDIYKDVKSQLKDGRYVLFTGTPCQVAALKSYLGNVNTDKLTTIDLICHGVPSVKSFKLYVSLLEKYKGIKIKKYQFRSKEYGWGFGAIEMTSERRGRVEKKIILSKEDFFKSNFSSWNSIRPSCTSCKYANFNRIGDFTMGDYWGWERLGMEIPTTKGLSVVLVNNPQKIQILKKLSLHLIKTPIEIARKGNETFNHSAKKGRYWNEFMKCVADNDFLPFYLGFEKYKKERQRKERIVAIKNKIKLPFRIIKKLFN